MESDAFSTYFTNAWTCWQHEPEMKKIKTRRDVIQDGWEMGGDSVGTGQTVLGIWKQGGLKIQKQQIQYYRF